MKKNYETLFACAVLFIAALCVITACGGGAGGGPSTPLEQLANELSAAASGDTVTITSKVVLTGSLTVPEGVTLDITSEAAALILENNAVLTVNGTVNVKGIHDGSYGIVQMPGGTPTAAINGSGIIRLKTQGLLLAISNRQKLILDGSVTLDDTMNNINDLVLVAGELDMRGGKITGNYNTSTDIDGGGVEVNGEDDASPALFTMSGSAEVSGNKAKLDGGGVNVCHGGTFIMKGNAKVSDNIADRDGGGVRVRQDEEYPATSFILEGGTVTGNTASGIGSYSGFPNNDSLIVYTGTAKWGAASTSISGGDGGRSPGGNILGGGTGATDDDLSATGS